VQSQSIRLLSTCLPSVQYQYGSDYMRKIKEVAEWLRAFGLWETVSTPSAHQLLRDALAPEEIPAAAPQQKLLLC
jgi:hypothetical protein